MLFSVLAYQGFEVRCVFVAACVPLLQYLLTVLMVKTPRIVNTATSKKIRFVMRAMSLLAAVVVLSQSSCMLHHSRLKFILLYTDVYLEYFVHVLVIGVGTFTCQRAPW